MSRKIQWSALARGRTMGALLTMTNTTALPPLPVFCSSRMAREFFQFEPSLKIETSPLTLVLFSSANMIPIFQMNAEKNMYIIIERCTT